MTQQQQQADPSPDSTTSQTPAVMTAEDVWAALADETTAATWRGLDAITVNLAATVRKARATVQAETPSKDALASLSDPHALVRAATAALDTLTRHDADSAPAATAATQGDLAALYWQRIAEQRDAAPTGLARLDKALGGGMQPGRLMIVLGAPGKGKTTLANQIAEHVASAGRPVVYATMEDPSWALLAKTIARLGSLDYGAVLQGWASMRPAINDALAKVASRQSAHRLLYVDVPGRLSLETLREQARAHFARYGVDAGGGPGLLVVDYLQRAARASMPAGVQSELRLAVSGLTDQLRDVARDLDCTVLALASQNRAGYGNGNGASALASAKESGDIEYGTDVLAAIGEDDKRIAPIDCKAYALRIDKNRQGEIPQPIALDWMPARQQFSEAAK